MVQPPLVAAQPTETFFFFFFFLTCFINRLWRALPAVTSVRKRTFPKEKKNSHGVPTISFVFSSPHPRKKIRFFFIIIIFQLTIKKGCRNQWTLGWWFWINWGYLFVEHGPGNGFFVIPGVGGGRMRRHFAMYEMIWFGERTGKKKTWNWVVSCNRGVTVYTSLMGRRLRLYI